MAAKTAITGILLVDKEPGYTSNAILQKVKKLLGAEKAGHTGTLDPLASGMLPICFGESTKVIRFLLAARKAYQVTMVLGQTMSTGDAEGSLLQTRPVKPLSLESLETLLASFKGPIEQIPPIYSALKQNGKRYYKLAREGREEEIELKPRSVHIDKLIVNHYQYIDAQRAYLTLSVECSKGTYIRSLAHDIGEKMGCGAYVSELRRTWVDPFQGQKMYTLEELMSISQLDNCFEKCLLASQSAIPDLPKVAVGITSFEALYQGKQVCTEKPARVGWVQLWCEGLNQFFGIGEVLASGHLAPRRLFKRVLL